MTVGTLQCSWFSVEDYGCHTRCKIRRQDSLCMTTSHVTERFPSASDVRCTDLITSLRYDRALSRVVLATSRAQAQTLLENFSRLAMSCTTGEPMAWQRQGETCLGCTRAWPRDDHRIATQVAVIGTSNNDGEVQQKSCSTHHSLRTPDTPVPAPETPFQPVPHGVVAPVTPPLSRRNEAMPSTPPTQSCQGRETAPVPPLTRAPAAPHVETSTSAESEPSLSVPVTLHVQRISSFIHVARTPC